MCFLKTYKPLKLFAMKTYVVNMHNHHCNTNYITTYCIKRINTHFLLSISKSFNDLEEAALVVLSNTYMGLYYVEYMKIVTVSACTLPLQNRWTLDINIVINFHFFCLIVYFYNLKTFEINVISFQKKRRKQLYHSV